LSYYFYFFLRSRLIFICAIVFNKKFRSTYVYVDVLSVTWNELGLEVSARFIGEKHEKSYGMYMTGVWALSQGVDSSGRYFLTSSEGREGFTHSNIE